jgi:hypothetical protein
MGWVFMPSFAEGESMAEQAAAAETEGSNGFNISVSEKSLADAADSGVTNFYSAQGSNLTSEDIRARQASHDWYTGGMDHYNGPVGGDSWKAEAEGWLLDRNGKPTITPWVDTFDHDAENTFNRMRQDNYNPFLGSEGRWVGDEQQGIGELGSYRDDSIAGWFKDQFAGEDMVKHRLDALNTLNGWNNQERHMGGWKDGLGKGINKGSTRMSRKFFDEMGLGEKFGLEWVEPESGASKLLNGTAEGGPSQAANMLRGNGGVGGRAGEMLRGGLMSGGGEAVRDVIYGKAQEKIFGE